MNNLCVWVTLVLVSIVWGFFHYSAGYYKEIDERNRYFKFLEYLRHCINYSISLLIAYYFVSVRWSSLSDGSPLSASDFILGAVFLMGVFGYIPYFVKNITEGINAILEKLLSK